MKKMRYRCSLKLLIAPERKKNFSPGLPPFSPFHLPLTLHDPLFSDRATIFRSARVLTRHNVDHNCSPSFLVRSRHQKRFLTISDSKSSNLKSSLSSLPPVTFSLFRLCGSALLPLACRSDSVSSAPLRCNRKAASRFVICLRVLCRAICQNHPVSRRFSLVVPLPKGEGEGRSQIE